MTPKDRLDASLTKQQENGCQTDSIVQKVKQAYDNQADRADKCLQEKQDRDMKKLLG